MARTTLLASLVPEDAPLVGVSGPVELGKFNLSRTSGAFAFQVVTENGAAVNLDIVLEFSLDGENYAVVSTETVETVSNTAIFDFPSGSGCSYAKLSVAIPSGGGGSFDVTKVLFRGKEER